MLDRDLVKAPYAVVDYDPRITTRPKVEGFTDWSPRAAVQLASVFHALSAPSSCVLLILGPYPWMVCEEVG